MISIFIKNNLIEDGKYYYIPITIINNKSQKDKIINYLTESNWKFVSHCSSRNPNIKNRRCYRVEKVSYDKVFQKPAENKVLVDKESQTVNLQDDEKSFENINFEQNLEEFDDENFDFNTWEPDFNFS